MEADRKTVKLERFHRRLFFLKYCIYTKLERVQILLLRRQNHYSTFNLNTGRTIDAKHRGLGYLQGRKKCVRRASEIKSRK